jgi:hypothetical protein
MSAPNPWVLAAVVGTTAAPGTPGLVSLGNQSGSDQPIQLTQSSEQATFAPNADAWRRALETEVEKLRQHVQAMEQKGRRARERIEQRISVAEQQAVAETETTDLAQSGELEAIEPEASTEVIVDDLQISFERESRDHAWAADAETAIYDLFDTEDLQASNLLNAECRETLCSFDSVHDTEQAQADFLDRFPGYLEGSAGFFITDVDQDGNAITQVFVAREGHGLPQL